MTDIQPNENMWYPGPDYAGRDVDYLELVGDSTRDRVIELVQKRAKEDGEWTIENDLVGDKPDKMRAMMVWASNENIINQCLDRITEEGMERQRTVDWVCRELAEATQIIGGRIG